MNAFLILFGLFGFFIGSLWGFYDDIKYGREAAFVLGVICVAAGVIIS